MSDLAAGFKGSDPRPSSEGGIGRKKPPRGWRTRGRKMATREQWAALRAEKLTECRLCSATEPFEPLELHHLVPRSAGGDDVADNLVALCRQCHDCVTRRVPADLADLAEGLSDGEYAYCIEKLGEGAMERLFGVGASR